MEKQKQKPEKKKTLNIYQRMNGVMADVRYIQKREKAAKGLPYKYVTHDDVTGALHDAFVKWGIQTITDIVNRKQDGNRTEVDVVVSFINIDNPEDKVNVNSFGYGIDNQDKGPGKAISYATKMAYLKSFMLETGEDPEKDNEDHKPSMISDEGIEELESLFIQVDPTLKSKTLKWQKVKQLDELTSEQYQKIRDALKKKIKEKQNG